MTSLSILFLVELEFENVGFWGQGKAGVFRENLSKQGREPTTNSPPTYGVDAGIWTRATLLGGECSHQCAILVPQPRKRTRKWCQEFLFLINVCALVSNDIHQSRKSKRKITRHALWLWKITPHSSKRLHHERRVELFCEIVQPTQTLVLVGTWCKHHIVVPR